MKRRIAFFLVIAMAFCLSACGGGNDSSGSSDVKQSAATKDEAASGEADSTAAPAVPEMTESEVETFEIETKYAVLKYPKKWEKDVNVKINDGDPYTVSFSSNNVPLFSLVFNGTQGDYIGTLKRDDGNVTLRIVSEHLDKNSDRYEDYASMAEDVNEILNHLHFDYGLEIGEPEEIDDSVYEIKTELATLYYPQRWKDKVSVSTKDNKVTFSSGETPLFTLVFGGEEGVPVGTYEGKQLCIIDYPVESDELANMQEDVNVILHYLIGDQGF